MPRFGFIDPETFQKICLDGDHLLCVRAGWKPSTIGNLEAPNSGQVHNPKELYFQGF